MNILDLLQHVDADMTVSADVKVKLALALEGFPNEVEQLRKEGLAEKAPLINGLIQDIKPHNLLMARLSANMLRDGDSNYHVGRAFDYLVHRGK